MGDKMDVGKEFLVLIYPRIYAKLIFITRVIDAVRLCSREPWIRVDEKQVPSHQN